MRAAAYRVIKCVATQGDAHLRRNGEVDRTRYWSMATRQSARATHERCISVRDVCVSTHQQSTADAITSE